MGKKAGVEKEAMGREGGRSLLMLCYYFPPLTDVGCRRSVAFARHLHQHGWRPYVLSVRNPDRHFCRVGNDPPPAGVAVEYVRSLFSHYWLFGKINGALARLLRLGGIALKRNYLHDLFSIPDLFVGWVPGAILGGYQAIRKHDLDCIYVSCTPYSAALAGIALKRLTGRPLIIDFRDPMAVNVPDIFGIPAFRRRLDLRLERRIIEAADLFLVTTEETRQGYLAALPEIAGKIFTVHNGFEHESVPAPPPEKFEKFTIVYAGNMYFHALRSTAFFDALAKLKEEGAIAAAGFRFLYFGQNRDQVAALAAERGIDDLVEATPAMPHRELLPILVRSHLQLLRIFKPMISTKLFEGIALNLPFLATIPEGEVADIIRRFSPGSFIVTSDSPEEIADAVLAAMRACHRGEVRANRVPEFLASFSRENLCRKLESIIDTQLFGGDPAVPRTCAPDLTDR